MTIFRQEAATILAFATYIVFIFFGDQLLPDSIGLVSSIGLLAVLFVVMLWAAFSVVHHAECLAQLLGEPYGTLILTLSVIGIEVALIASIMITGSDKPTLARDTIFSIIMIVLNGLVGLSLIVGGLKHKMQEYNLQGANAYLTILMPFALLGLVLPRFTESAPGGELSGLMAVFLTIFSLVMFGIFLAFQTISHSHIFQHSPSATTNSTGSEDHHELKVTSVPYHAIGLLAALLPIILLSKKLALYVDFGISSYGAPLAFGGFLIAALILTPEGLSAIRAARKNELQRSINICLGSGLSTMGLTIPTVLAIAWITNEHVELGLETTEIVMLAATLIVSMLTFSSQIGRAHV